MYNKQKIIFNTVWRERHPGGRKQQKMTLAKLEIYNFSGYTIKLSNKTTQIAGRNYLDSIRQALIRLSEESL